MKWALLVLLLVLPAQAGKDAFSQPFDFLSREARRPFFTGNSFFNENWVAAPASTAGRDGLGPLFQARSCSACHRLDGRGLPPSGPEDVFLGLVVRLGKDASGDPLYGSQLSNQAIPGATPEATPQLTWVDVPGTYPDGQAYRLRRPEVRFVGGTVTGPISLRLAPAVFGGGLLENIPLSTLQAWADPEDKNGDGISGRLATFPDGKTGRFGWKAHAIDLADQTARAFLMDMGLRTTQQPTGDLTASQEQQFAQLPHGGIPEVSDLIFQRVVHYLRALAPPAARPPDPVGQKLFTTLQCAACHQPSATTRADPTLPELANRPVAAYTNLLLHDMGAELADGRPEGPATGKEWRTPPLWGLGLHVSVSGSVALMHDGRARTVEEAILWHGGEAEASRKAFQQLPAEERLKLLEFLTSL